MAKAGRDIKLYKGSGVGAVLIAGGRTDTISINTEAIDVTDKGDDGWRTLIADPATRSVDITAEVVFSDDAFLEISLDSDPAGLLDEYEVRIKDAGVIAGTFHLSSAELVGAHTAEATQTIKLASSGPVTWTATP